MSRRWFKRPAPTPVVERAGLTPQPPADVRPVRAGVATDTAAAPVRVREQGPCPTGAQSVTNRAYPLPPAVPAPDIASARRIVEDWQRAAETPHLLPGGGAEMSLIRAAVALLAELDRTVDVERGYIASLAVIRHDLREAFGHRLSDEYVEPDQAGAILRRAVGE